MHNTLFATYQKIMGQLSSFLMAMQVIGVFLHFDISLRIACMLSSLPATLAFGLNQMMVV